MTKKHGFSPYQHVFGNELRLPGLISEGESLSQQYDGRGATHPQDAFHERQRIRQAARKAMVQIDEDEKVRRALDHRTRPPKINSTWVKSYTIGEEFEKTTKRGLGKVPQESLAFMIARKFGYVMATRF